MLHVHPSLDQYLRLGRKFSLISSRPSAASDAAVSSVRVVPSGLAKSALNSLANRILDPRGRLLMASMASSMVGAF